MSEGDLILFAGRGIRRTLVDGQWWFAVVDIVAALSESASPSDYWFRLKRSEKDATGLEFSTITRLLRFKAPDGNEYMAEAVNAKGAFRVIQAIPSSKAEPFRKLLERYGAAAG
jgi:DNA-damage-inducible protein D